MWPLLTHTRSELKSLRANSKIQKHFCIIALPHLTKILSPVNGSASVSCPTHLAFHSFAFLVKHQRAICWVLLVMRKKIPSLVLKWNSLWESWKCPLARRERREMPLRYLPYRTHPYLTIPYQIIWKYISIHWMYLPYNHSNIENVDTKPHIRCMVSPSLQACRLPILNRDQASD